MDTKKASTWKSKAHAEVKRMRDETTTITSNDIVMAKTMYTFLLRFSNDATRSRAPLLVNDIGLHM
jgi:hypothetical protein